MKRYIVTIAATPERFDALFAKGELSWDFLVAAQATKSFRLVRDNDVVTMSADSRDWDSLIDRHLVGDDIRFVISNCRENVDIIESWRSAPDKILDQTLGRVFNHLTRMSGGIVKPVAAIERTEPTGEHYPADGKPYSIKCELFSP
jgi:hypothetical protein